MGGSNEPRLWFRQGTSIEKGGERSQGRDGRRKAGRWDSFHTYAKMIVTGTTGNGDHGWS